MASLVIAGTPILKGSRTTICQAADYKSDTGSGTNVHHPAALPFRKREVLRGAAWNDELRRRASTRDFLDRRQVMLLGAASLLGSLGAGVGAARAAEEKIEDAATNPLIQKLLETSKANKAANDAARLEDYYRRNYKEYFEFVVGSVRNKKELTPAEKAIVEWLCKGQTNCPT